MAGAMTFRGTIRFFRPEQKAGLAVIDVPGSVSSRLGGLKQQRVQGKRNGVAFASNVMPAGGGVLALTLSKKLLDAAGLKVGQRADVELAGSA